MNEYEKPENAVLRAALAMPVDRWSEALVLVKQQIQLNPSSAIAFRTQGILLKGLEDLDGAIESFKHAIQLSAKSAGSILLELGEAYLENDQAHIACDVLGNAIEQIEMTPDPLNLQLAHLARGVAAFDSGNRNLLDSEVAHLDDHVSYFYIDRIWNKALLLECFAEMT